jgi:hypothetical protein
LNPGKIDLAEGDFKNKRKPLLSLGHELPEGHVEESGKVEKNDSPSSYPSTDGIQRMPLFIREQSFWDADRGTHGDFQRDLEAFNFLSIRAAENIFLKIKYNINLRNFLFKYCSRGRNMVDKGIPRSTSSIASKS